MRFRLLFHVLALCCRLSTELPIIDLTFSRELATCSNVWQKQEILQPEWFGREVGQAECESQRSQWTKGSDGMECPVSARLGAQYIIPPKQGLVLTWSQSLLRHHVRLVHCRDVFHHRQLSVPAEEEQVVVRHRKGTDGILDLQRRQNHPALCRLHWVPLRSEASTQHAAHCE